MYSYMSLKNRNFEYKFSYLKYNGKMQNTFPDYDNFSIFGWFLYFMLVSTVWISSIKVIFGQDLIRLRKSNSCTKVFKFWGLKLLDFYCSEVHETLAVLYLRFKPRPDVEFGRWSCEDWEYWSVQVGLSKKI